MAENNNTSDRSENKNKSRAGKVFYLLGLFLLILIILFAGAVLLPQLFGVQEYAVVSGSMEPEIPVGSLVFVTPADAVELEVGDIVAYMSGSSQVPVVHRVIANNPTEYNLSTKGDANDQEDILPVEYSRVIGKVTFHIPVVGRIFMIAGR